MSTSLQPDTRNASSSSTDDINILPLLTTFAVRWRLLLSLPLATAAAAVALSLVLVPRYTAVTSFVTEAKTGRDLGQLAGLASQLGVGTSSPSLGPQFYGAVLQSRQVLVSVLNSRTTDTSSDADSVRVLDLLMKPDRSTAVRLEKGIGRLRSASSVAVDLRTGIITLSVSLRSPQMASFVARQFISALNNFNLQTRRSQAGERRRFAQERLAEAQDSLSRTENAVRDFLVRNRQYRDSPTLVFEYERLQRQVQVYQELFVTLRREYETARLDEVNDTPVITVLDVAIPPTHRSSPSRIVAAVTGGLLGLLAAVLFATGEEYFRRLRRRRPEEFAKMETAVTDIRRLLSRRPPPSEE